MQAGEKQFVNPYTFVPFPEDGIRREPAPGHTFDTIEAGRRFSGSFTATWTVQTPLALPEGQGWYDPTKKVVDIPGSSAKGAIRSVHETLFGGCPRVLTSAFVPVYRQLMAREMVDKWKLAVVIEAGDDGDPRAVRLCDDQVWINARALHQAYGGALPCTGDTLRLTTPRYARHTGLKRDEYPGRKASIPSGALKHTPRSSAAWARGDYVFLVTDVAARKTTRNQHAGIHPIPALFHGTTRNWEYRQEVADCFWAAGKLGKRIATFESEADSSALAAFSQLSEGTRDRQENEQFLRDPDRDQDQRTSPDLFTPVEWWTLPAGEPMRRDDEDLIAANKSHPVVRRRDGRFLPLDQTLFGPIAQRRRSDGKLYRGDVIWVQCAKENGRLRVTAVKLAAAWRETPPLRPPEGRPDDLGGRVKPTPCHTHKQLCLSCAVFGSIDPNGDDAGPGQQVAYRGHVRFGAVRGDAVRVGDPIRLAPLSSPHPGTGMFYLKNQVLPTNRDPHDSPNRWGSAIDDPQKGPGPRPARGRKYYWHSDPAAQVAALPTTVANPKPRYQARGAEAAPDPSTDATVRQPGDGFQTLARLVQPGQSLTQTVTFDGLDRLSLLTLLAAFDPSLILEPLDSTDEYAIHLGGGKPLGLGTVTAKIDQLQVSSVAARYTSADDTVPDWSWTADDRAALTARVGNLDQVHQAAATVLRRHGLGEHEPYVTYPITTTWSQYGKPEFTKSFEFFQRSSGEQLANEQARPYVVLPDLNAVADGANPAITNEVPNA